MTLKTDIYTYLTTLCSAWQLAT